MKRLSIFVAYFLTILLALPSFAQFGPVPPAAPNGTFPSGWLVRLMTGSIPAFAGGDYYSENGLWVLRGCGLTFGTADTTPMTCQSITGDFTLTAQISNIAGSVSTDGAIANDEGIFLQARESVAAGSKVYGGFLENNALSDGGTGFNIFDVYRTTLNGSYTTNRDATSISTPQYMRIQRIGNTFATYYSSDGVTYTQAGSTQTIVLNSTLLVGLSPTNEGGAANTTAVTVLCPVITLSQP